MGGHPITDLGRVETVSLTSYGGNADTTMSQTIACVILILQMRNEGLQ